VPEEFKLVDFKNRSYGSYKFADGKIIDLTLKAGEREIVDYDHGSFSLKDVFYRDVTGDGVQEAIVMLTHESCGGSCDGGASLIYIYTMRKGKLKEIWQYETGSYAYGCGLKSFTIRELNLVVELFGRCQDEAIRYSSSQKFQVSDLTFLHFTFDDRRFVQTKKEYFATGWRDVTNYEPEIQID